MKRLKTSVKKPSGILLLLFFLFSLFTSLQAQGDGKLTADLQMLTRGEIQDGGLPGDTALVGDRVNFVKNRTRLILGYERPHLTAKVNIQHVTVWGAGQGGFNIYEAWARLSSSGGLFVQAGRQALSYDDERIIGPNDWAMDGNSHDAILLGFEGQKHHIHLIAAYNQNDMNLVTGSDFYDITQGSLPYKTMQTLWYHYDLPWTPLGISLLGMNIGMQGGARGLNEHIEWQQLVGGYLRWSPIDAMFTLEGSYYRQFGHNEKGIKIDAWMAAVKAAFDPSPVYGFVAGFDYLSGDEYFAVPASGAFGLTQHKVIRGFSTVYGSHHKFYGAMDYFYVSAYVNGFSPGLQNAYVGAHICPIEGLRIDASYHYMAMSVKLRGIDMTLGHELELEASYRVMKHVTLAAGFSYMTGTETMRRLKRASSDSGLRWAWVNLIIDPRIFEK